METIVVGVDGSEPSQRALEWAAAEARLRNAKLRVVHAWLEVFISGYFAAPAVYEREVVEEAAREELDKAIASIPGGSADLTLEPVLEHGQPEVVLFEQSKDASLVVVGSRGRGSFAEFVLGSVSYRLVHRATCPIVVVH